MFKEINVAELEIYIDSLDLKEETYIITYPYFIKYFENLDFIEKKHLVISSHFVYGWMPTIINLKLTKLDAILSVLNKAKQGKLLSEDELLIGKEAINNSMVGLSKLLHFINPKIYAIWDSRIFRFLTNKKSSYGISEPKNYINYLKYLDKLGADKLSSKFHKKINNAIGYEVSLYRAIELVMFEADKRRYEKNN